MNYFFAFLVLIGAPKGPQIYVLNGATLARLNTILVPNIRRGNFQFFIKSPYELKHARVDSSELSLRLLDRSTVKKMRLRGRWYKLSWDAELKTGSETHTILLTARSGAAFKFDFTVNVEGSKKSKSLRGED